MFPEYLVEAILVLSVAAVAYHHVGYPLLLNRIAALLADREDSNLVRDTDAPVSVAHDVLPSITIIVPAYNEQSVIAQKVENVASLDYPLDKLTVIIALDGCTDDTRVIAEAAIARAGRGYDIRVVDYAVNRGKIAVLNEEIARVGSDVVALNDASGMIERDALLRAARHFLDNEVGVVCATYRLPKAGSLGEAKYWEMQTRIKACEALIAAPMGAHGALYFFRRVLWKPLPPDTINDDFVLPMQIVADGHRAIYDQSIIATELEATETSQEFKRRIRIGAGNMQQLVRLKELGDPRLPGLAFVFLSGKGMRPVVPFLMLTALLATLALASRDDSVFQVLLAIEVAGIALAWGLFLYGGDRLPRPVAWASYLIVGHTASAVGALAFLTGKWKGPWKPASHGDGTWDVIPRTVAWAKRAFDVVAAIAGLFLLAVVFIPVAIAIRRESPGAIVFRQQRVGRSTQDRTELFELFKFRTMYEDAERLTGPVMAGEDDPRVTRVGRFLRKTRLDELPQFINVLRGDMSMIGPRPERPVFVRRLNNAIPFYPERTLGLRPGMTGLAQVKQTYQQSVDEVGMKVAYDHAYAMRVQRSVWSWAKTDLEILWRTLVVVVRGTGQ